MSALLVAYLAGLLTIVTPCIVPILPFLLARADTPFRRGGLPMLLGLALAFAAVASLAAVAGGWAVEANRYGRIMALSVMTLFGLTLLLPALAAGVARPIVSLGAKLAALAGQRDEGQGGVALADLLGAGWAAGRALGRRASDCRG